MEAAEIQARDGDAHSVYELRGALVVAARDLGPVIRVPRARASEGSGLGVVVNVASSPLSGAYATYLRSPQHFFGPPATYEMIGKILLGVEPMGSCFRGPVRPSAIPGSDVLVLAC